VCRGQFSRRASEREPRPHPEVVRDVDDDRVAVGHVRLLVPVAREPVSHFRLFSLLVEQRLQFRPRTSFERLGFASDLLRGFGSLGERFARADEARECVVEFRQRQFRQLVLVPEHDRVGRDDGRDAHAPVVPVGSLYGRHGVGRRRVHAASGVRVSSGGLERDGASERATKRRTSTAAAAHSPQHQHASQYCESTS
jgi:hypothetical protein